MEVVTLSLLKRLCKYFALIFIRTPLFLSRHVLGQFCCFSVSILPGLVHFRTKLFTVEDRKDTIRPNQKPLVLF